MSIDLMREALVAVEAHGSVSAAARALDIPKSTFDHRIKKAREHFGAPEGQQAAIEVTGTFGAARHGWRVVQHEDGSRDSVFWKNEPAHEDLATVIAEALADTPTPEPVEHPEGPENMCAVFPVADLHIGMQADAEEVGEDWNGKKATREFALAFQRLVDRTPDAGVAVMAQLGDLMHADDQRNVTPQNKHQLDVDSRYFMNLRRAVAAMKCGIEILRRKYPMVIYKGSRGNHDMTAHYAVTLALAEHYRSVEGVEIVENASEFYVHEFGANMLILHHGDRAKPERLHQFATSEWADIWGRTKHRLALSGHVHHAASKEVGGMRFESVGTIIPRDAYAFSHGYTASRGLVSISLDRDEGETSRTRVNLT